MTPAAVVAAAVVAAAVAVVAVAAVATFVAVATAPMSLEFFCHSRPGTKVSRRGPN